MRCPRVLPPGGTIGIVNPSSPVELDLLDSGIAVLESRGFQVVVAPHVRDRYGHLAGRDQDRAADFFSFYADPALDVVWCARGGSSACRLWPLLDWDALAALPPKMVIGYSDTTSLLIPLNQRVGAVALHGPLVFELGAEEPNPPTPFPVKEGGVRDNFSPFANREGAARGFIGGAPGLGSLLEWQLRLLQDPTPAGDVPGGATDTLVGGAAEGQLCGGCLSLVAATLGTPYQINAAGKLLLLEDVDEAPHRVERFLAQLREAGVLASAAGFLIGQATGADDSRTLPMRQIWAEFLEPCGKPAVLGFPFGHVEKNYALPLGVRARLDADARALTLLEPAVV